MKHDAREKSSQIYTLPEKPEAAAKAVMETIELLRDIYARENQALDNADTPGFLALQDKKLKAARRYQIQMSQLLKRKEELKALPSAFKQKIEETQAEFAALSQKNMEAVRRMQRSVDRLGRLMRRAAIDAAKDSRAVGYNETGSAEDGDDRKSVSTGSINETA